MPNRDSSLREKGTHMFKIFIICLFLWIGYVSPVAGGIIRGMDIVEDSDSKLEVVIKGICESYHSVVLPSPYRLVIDLANCCFENKQFRNISLKGSVVSKIRTGKTDKGMRIVFDSADPSATFRYNMASQDGSLLVKCWSAAAKVVIRDGDEKDKDKIKTNTDETVSVVKDRYMPLPEPKKDLEDLFGPIEKSELKTGEQVGGEKVPTYTGDKITMEFYKADLHNVFRLFSEISGKNIILSEDVKGELTLSLRDVPWDFALDLILDVENLRKEERLNTFIISTREQKVDGKGELIVRKVSSEALQPARRLKRREKDRREAQKLILEAHQAEKKGKKDEALSLYEKAGELWKDNVDLLKKIAFLHYSLGNFSRGYYFAGRALKINQNDAEAALYAALAAVRLNRTKEARILFDIAIKGDPKIPEVFYNYALFAEKQGDLIHSLSLYERYEELFGPSFLTGLAIARHYEILGNKKKACEKYKEIQLSGFAADNSNKRFIYGKINELCGVSSPTANKLHK